MFKFYTFFFLLFSFINSNTITAQETKPVQFYPSSGRDPSGQAFVLIKAKVADGVKVFSAKKKSPDDAFVTSVDFDSTSKQYLKDSLQESGNLKTSIDSVTGGSEIRFFSDSVVWKQLLNIAANDSAKIKGTITWLGSRRDEFPSGEETFSVKVKAVASPSAATNSDDVSLWSTFWLCLITGLLAVLTPCVFPLVPVTVSFFLKGVNQGAKELEMPRGILCQSY
jgi:thiol:disulfide interchange protein DsbD